VGQDRQDLGTLKDTTLTILVQVRTRHQRACFGHDMIWPGTVSDETCAMSAGEMTIKDTTLTFLVLFRTRHQMAWNCFGHEIRWPGTVSDETWGISAGGIMNAAEDAAACMCQIEFTCAPSSPIRWRASYRKHSVAGCVGEGRERGGERGRKATKHRPGRYQRAR